MTNYKVLSIRQPWAHLIVTGIKPVENRSWITSYRGPILIHASQRYDDRFGLEQDFGIDPDELEYGKVIGRVDLVDIVTDHASPFFSGPYGWVLDNPRSIDPVPLRGQVRLFNASLKLPRHSRPR